MNSTEKIIFDLKQDFKGRTGCEPNVVYIGSDDLGHIKLQHPEMLITEDNKRPSFFGLKLYVVDAKGYLSVGINR